MTPRFASLLAALLLSSLVPGSAEAASPGTLFATVGDDMYSLDASTGAGAFIADTVGPVYYDDLTYDTVAGVFYGTAGVPAVLYSIDPLTMSATVIGPFHSGPTTFDGCEGLSFNPLDGLLYATLGSPVGASHHLAIVDPATASATIVATLSGTLDGGDGDSLQWAGSTLFLIDASGPTSVLYTLDPLTGSATTLGVIGVGGVNDMAYDADADILYGLASYTHELYTLDQSTGVGSLVGPTLIGDSIGFTWVPGASPPPPVPELGAWMLVSVGLVGLAVVASRRA